MDSVLTQLQREIQKISKKQNQSRQDNYSQSLFNASPIKVNQTQRESSRERNNNLFSSSQSFSFSSPQTLKLIPDQMNSQVTRSQQQKEINMAAGNNHIGQQDYNQQNQMNITQNSLDMSHRSETSSHREKNAQTAQMYNSRREEVKELFQSKDELFKRAQLKFKHIISSKQRLIHLTQQSHQDIKSYWESKETELKELINEIQEQQDAYKKSIIQQKQKLSQQWSQHNLSQEKSKNGTTASHSQERKVWLSKNPKIGKRAIPLQNESRVQNLVNEYSERQLSQREDSEIQFNQSDSDCNIDDEETIFNKQSHIQKQNQILQDLQFQELSIEIASQNYNQIQNFLTILIQTCNEISNVCGQPIEEKLKSDVLLFSELEDIQVIVNQLEDRYFTTTIAWEKELRDLIQKQKVKSQKIVESEKLVNELNMKKNELQFKYDTLTREIELINKSLQIQYGFSFSNYNSIERTTQLDLEHIKKVFDENKTLKDYFEKLLENIESSRGELLQYNSQNRAAVQGIPALIGQQYKLAKESFENQLQTATQQFDQKLQSFNSELAKSRQKVIDLLDEKQKFEKDIFQLKLEKKDLKNDTDLKLK